MQPRTARAVEFFHTWNGRCRGYPAGDERDIHVGRFLP